MNNTGKFKYIQSFDSIRGIATLFVLLIHGSYGLFKGAWIALDLFFILSGYLITSILQHEYKTSGGISLSNFYIRRGLKIIPPLLICIILANILWPFTDFAPGANQVLSTVGGIFYFTNFLQVRVTGNMIHLWSLAVEEHFYFVWPLMMVFLIPKISFRKAVIFLAAVALMSTVFRIIAFNFHFSGELFVVDSFRSTFGRVDGIILGVLLAFFLNKRSIDLGPKIESKLNVILAAIFIVFVIILFTVSETNAYLNNGGFIITNFLCVFTILIAVKNLAISSFQIKFFVG